jgi:hypothetical protein
VTAMTPRVPQPLAADGVVTDDVAARTLVVRLSERAGGVWAAAVAAGASGVGEGGGVRVAQQGDDRVG